MQQLPMLSLPRIQIQSCSGEYSKFDVGIIRPISRTEVLGAFSANLGFDHQCMEMKLLYKMYIKREAFLQWSV